MSTYAGNYNILIKQVAGLQSKFRRIGRKHEARADRLNSLLAWQGLVAKIQAQLSLIYRRLAIGNVVELH